MLRKVTCEYKYDVGLRVNLPMLLVGVSVSKAVMSEWSGLSKLCVVMALATVAVTTVAVVMMSRAKKRKRSYELVGHVSALYCYPVKSCAGITNKVAFCTFSGLRMSNAMDRHFLIVRSDGTFVTQRQVPKLAAIKTSVVGQDLQLDCIDKDPIRIPLYPETDEDSILPCRIWKSTLRAQLCGQHVSEWLSSAVGEEDLSLVVYMAGVTHRQSSTKNATDKDQVSFPDESPYHLATEESFADLMSRIKEHPDEGKITMQHFRPNIVIKGVKSPWDEDSWEMLKIGKKLEMRVLAPCDRCVMTTVDPVKYKRRSDEEPLKTLRSFRIFPEVSKTAPLFGIFAGVNVENTIRIGDPVYAVRK
ncbi:Mitochondrial amidoxime reducing component 2 [Bulinus truncatus]|nr:Mitochondrial amidoxime reducing component 2 [Bulinus truncatus]